jgi:hypothetical protein
MTRKDARSATPLTRDQRKRRLARIVENGEISAERAKLIDLDREPSAAARAFAQKLAPHAKEFLA